MNTKDDLIKWVIVLVAIAYIANLGAGVIEIVPDNAPLFGNLDEAVVAIVGYSMATKGKLLA